MNLDHARTDGAVNQKRSRPRPMPRSYDSHIVFTYSAAASLPPLWAGRLEIPQLARSRFPTAAGKNFLQPVEVAHTHWCCRWFIMRSVVVAESPEIAMSMTAYFPLAETQAGARRSPSMWRRVLDAMIESRRRKTEEEVDRYLRRLFPTQARDELTSRGMGS